MDQHTRKPLPKRAPDELLVAAKRLQKKVAALSRRSLTLAADLEAKQAASRADIIRARLKGKHP